MKPDPNTVFTPFGDDKGLLLHLQSKRYFTLNETGLRIWQSIEDGLSAEETALLLSQEFEIDACSAETKFHSFAHELLNAGLLLKEVAGGAAS